MLILSHCILKRLSYSLFEQSSAINFLSTHKMDFNQVFNNGNKYFIIDNLLKQLFLKILHIIFTLFICFIQIGVYFFSKEQQQQMESYKTLQESRNDILKSSQDPIGQHLKDFLSLNEATVFENIIENLCSSKILIKLLYNRQSYSWQTERGKKQNFL